jgi:uncharacterized protein YmfQ (DUF2313 family)
MGVADRLPQSAYLEQLQALLPPGAAWPRDPDAVLTRILDSTAAEMARIDGRAADLALEADPRTTIELLADWERVLGLPDPCSGLAPDLAGRRAQVTARLTALGGQSVAFFIALGAALGYTVSIEEFRPFTCDSQVDDSIDPHPWPFAWRVQAPRTTVRVMSCASACDEPIRSWGNQPLECLFQRLAPAHTKVLFAYGAADDWGRFIDPSTIGENWGRFTDPIGAVEDWGRFV